MAREDNILKQKDLYEIITKCAQADLDELNNRLGFNRQMKFYAGTWEDEITLQLKTCLVDVPGKLQALDTVKMAEAANRQGIFYQNELFKLKGKMEPEKFADYLITYDDIPVLRVQCLEFKMPKLNKIEYKMFDCRAGGALSYVVKKDRKHKLKLTDSASKLLDAIADEIRSYIRSR